MASSSGWTPMFSAADVHSSGNSLPDAVAAAQSRHQLLLRQRAGLEELFHQRFVGFGDHLDERFARRRLPASAMSAGIVGFGELAAAVGQKHVRLLRDEIDDAAKRFFFADRQLNRNDRAAQRAVNRLQRALEARALAIEPIDDDEPRQPGLLGGLPGFFGLHLHARDRVDDDDRGVGDAQRRARVGEKVRDARRVDEVDFGLVPLGVGEAGGERVLAGDFFFVEVGDGGAVVDLAEPVDRAGIEEGGRGELGFSGSRCGRPARHSGCSPRHRPS